MSAATTLSSVPKVILSQLEVLIEKAHTQKDSIQDFLESPSLEQEKQIKINLMLFIAFLDNWNPTMLKMCQAIVFLEAQNAQEKS